MEGGLILSGRHSSWPVYSFHMPFNDLSTMSTLRRPASLIIYFLDKEIVSFRSEWMLYEHPVMTYPALGKQMKEKLA